MLFQTYPSTRPRPQGVLHSILPSPSVPKQTQTGFPAPTIIENRPTDSDKARARQFDLTPEEFVRRDKIVRQMWIDCSYRTGEMLRPRSEEAFHKYGRCRVAGIYKSYHDFSTAEAKDWPDDDRPFTLTVDPDKKKDGTSLLLVVPEWLCRFHEGGAS